MDKKVKEKGGFLPNNSSHLIITLYSEKINIKVKFSISFNK